MRFPLPRAAATKAFTMLGRVARELWVGFGVALLLLLVIEGFSIFLSYVNPMRPQNVDWRVFADSYQNKPWVREYWKEFAVAGRGRYAPYLGWVNKPYQGTYFHFDQNGNRRTWKKVLPGSKPLRIFMFGGSTLWGIGVRDDYTIPSCLARLLSEKAHQNVVITNFGQIGYVSTQEIFQLSLQLRQGRIPDLAIFYDGVNDVYSVTQSHEAGVPLNNTNRIREFNLFAGSDRMGMAKEFLLNFIRQSRTYHVVDHFLKLNHPLEIQPDQTAPLAQAVVRIYFSNLRLSQQIGKSVGFSTLYYWQPFLYTKKYPTSYEQKQLEMEKSWKGLFLKANEAVEGQAKSSGVSGFHDITHLLDHLRRPLFVDACHVTEEGNEIIARRMLVDVLPEIEKLKAKGGKP